jgi:Bacterial Ig-like domain (group 1)
MRSPWIACGAIGLLALTPAACNRETAMPPTPPVAEVRVTPSAVTLAAGESAQLAAEVDDATGAPIGGAPIAFASTDRKKLSASAAGFIQSEGPSGRAEVVVSSGGKQTYVPVKITAGAPDAVEAIGGDGQSAIAGTPLPQPIVVRVLDDRRNPVSGSEVAFVAADGGIADPRQEATGPSGEARAQWTLGPEAGAQVLSATVKGTKTAATFSAQADSGPPAKLAPHSELLARGARGDSQALAVRVTDAEGNAKPGVTVHWRIEAGAGKLSSDSSSSDDTGTARVVLSAGKKPGRRRIVASTGALTARIEIAPR